MRNIRKLTIPNCLHLTAKTIDPASKHIELSPKILPLKDPYCIGCKILSKNLAFFDSKGTFFSFGSLRPYICNTNISSKVLFISFGSLAFKSSGSASLFSSISSWESYAKF